MGVGGRGNWALEPQAPAVLLARGDRGVGEGLGEERVEGVDANGGGRVVVLGGRLVTHVTT